MHFASGSDIVSNAAKIAERLMAHARLCQQIAEQTWSEDAARKLDQLADDCRRAAAELAPGTVDDERSTRH
jgi:hypothetical protein